MGEDFRTLSVSSDVTSSFLSQLTSIKSNLQSFINQTSEYWKGSSFTHLVSEQSNCVSNCNNLRNLVAGLQNIINLINKHIADLNTKEQLEEENRRLYPDLYWYDSDGDRHTNKAVQRKINSNNSKIAQLKRNLDDYVNQINNITGGV